MCAQLRIAKAYNVQRSAKRKRRIPPADVLGQAFKRLMELCFFFFLAE